MKSTSRRGLLNIFIVLFTISFTFASVFAQAQKEQTIRITAKKFEYSPNEIRLKKGVPVVLEFTSLDRVHGFNCPHLGVRTDISPGKVSTVRILPEKTGVYEFHCDIFCGEGHEDMSGKIIVDE